MQSFECIIYISFIFLLTLMYLLKLGKGLCLIVLLNNEEEKWLS